MGVFHDYALSFLPKSVGVVSYFIDKDSKIINIEDISSLREDDMSSFAYEGQNVCKAPDVQAAGLDRRNVLGGDDALRSQHARMGLRPGNILRVQLAVDRKRRAEALRELADVLSESARPQCHGSSILHVLKGDEAR